MCLTKKEKALIVLGNGFDIQCKYYTKYINFKHFVEIWDFIKSAVNIRENNRERSDSGGSYYIDTEYEDDIDFFIKNVNNATFYRQDIERIDKIFGKENAFCRFLFLTMNEDVLWSDIEKTLEDLLRSLHMFFKLIEKCIAKNIDVISEEYININCNNKEIFKYLYFDSLRGKVYNSFKFNVERNGINLGRIENLREDEEDMINNLYNSLKAFNMAFSIYLYVYVCGLNNLKFKYKDCEQNGSVIYDLTSIIRKYDCEIINFNYTHSHKEILSLGDKNKNREINFIHNSCEYIRNGNCFKYPEIIIGITDGTFSDDNTFYNRFEKSKLMSRSNSSINIREIVDSAQLYVIYGHSLSKNDKHLFKQIFNEVKHNNKKIEIYYYSSNDLYNKVDNIKVYLDNDIDDLNKLSLSGAIKFIKQNI